MHCKGGGSIIKDEEPDIGWQSHHFVRRKCAEKDVVSTDLGEPRRNGRRRDFSRAVAQDRWGRYRKMGGEEPFPGLWPRIDGKDEGKEEEMGDTVEKCDLCPKKSGGMYMNCKKWIFLLLALGFIYAANNISDFNIYKIEPPTCKYCGSEITGEHCPSCARKIVPAAEFQYDGKKADFGLFFESYEDYETYITTGKIRNIAAIPIGLIGAGNLVCFLYCCYRDKHKKSQFV